jgi:hypothetical protein
MQIMLFLVLCTCPYQSYGQEPSIVLLSFIGSFLIFLSPFLFFAAVRRKQALRIRCMRSIILFSYLLCYICVDIRVVLRIGKGSSMAYVEERLPRVSKYSQNPKQKIIHNLSTLPKIKQIYKQKMN